jgi:hypothetical protein
MGDMKDAARLADPRDDKPRLRCVGCGYYESELDPNKECEAYESAGHNLIEVDADGMAIPNEAALAAFNERVAGLKHIDPPVFPRDAQFAGTVPPMPDGSEIEARRYWNMSKPSNTCDADPESELNKKYPLGSVFQTPCEGSVASYRLVEHAGRPIRREVLLRLCDKHADYQRAQPGAKIEPLLAGLAPGRVHDLRPRPVRRLNVGSFAAIAMLLAVTADVPVPPIDPEVERQRRLVADRLRPRLPDDEPRVIVIDSLPQTAAAEIAEMTASRRLPPPVLAARPERRKPLSATGEVADSWPRRRHERTAACPNDCGVACPIHGKMNAKLARRAARAKT